MSSFPPPAPPRSDEHAGETPLWLIIGGIGLIVMGLVAAGLVVVSELKPKAGPSYPATWDARVAPYARIAARKRGLTFMHPVTVKFLPAKAFEKTVTGDAEKLNAKDRQTMTDFTGLMRALGLIRGEVDLFKAVNEFSGAGVLAYYSFDDKTITVRGEKVTPAIGATLVHEMTHVLQDQHFAIGKRQADLRKQDKKKDTSAESSVLDAIIEGDASRVATLYRASLPARKRKALSAGEGTDSARATARLKKSKVPQVIIAMESSPYTLGEALVQAAAAEGGNDAVNTLFRDAPTEETALLDPLRGLSEHRKAVPVGAPRLQKGEKKFDSGGFGVLSWYLMLAERLPAKTALDAADGWGGDAYVAYNRNHIACAQMNYAGRTSQDTTRMLLALQRWVAAAPGTPAKVGLERGLVRFESCDPGKKADVGKDAAMDAISLVATRGYLGVNFLESGVADARARCMAGRITRTYTVRQLNDPSFGATPDAKARVQRLVAGCRA